MSNPLSPDDPYLEALKTKATIQKDSPSLSDAMAPFLANTDGESSSEIPLQPLQINPPRNERAKPGISLPSSLKDDHRVVVWLVIGAALFSVGWGGMIALDAAGEAHPILMTALFLVGSFGTYALFSPVFNLPLPGPRVSAPPKWWFAIPLLATVAVLVLGVLLVISRNVPGWLSNVSEATGRSQRIFIPQSLDQLVKVYDGRTSAEADRILAPDFGNWIKVRGHINDMTTVDMGLPFESATVIVEMSEYPTVALHFNANWRGRLNVMRKGDSLVASCKIGPSLVNLIQLDDCELIP